MFLSLFYLFYFIIYLFILLLLLFWTFSEEMHVLLVSKQCIFVFCFPRDIDFKSFFFKIFVVYAAQFAIALESLLRKVMD